jgi:hypothetical protein
MIYTDDQIAGIIKTNPQKKLVKCAQDQAAKLKTLIHGENLSSALSRDTYFENNDIFTSRNKDAMSNKDLFARLFQREQMVFTAQGGASYFTGINDAQVKQLNELFADIRYSMTLRKWVEHFALPAFRCDPMGVIFIESDQNAYPTYKCSSTVYDYLPNGRKLEYISFQLTKADCDLFKVEDEKLKDQQPDFKTNYYRFVDDLKDVIVNYENSVVTEIDSLNHGWTQTPAFIISDIISFDDTQKFLSPVHEVLELATSFLNDRSIRDLQKKYHGFLKAIEPLLQCGICEGTGYLSGSACPECTPLGGDKGTGYKLRTKVADVARFPIKTGSGENFDFNKYFGYVKLPIEVWDKQDTSLQDIENLITDVYWGTEKRQSTTGPKKGDKSIEETATKTLANLQPIYARLNQTADWAEKTENIIADFVGKKEFSSFKKSQISYGRYYILETPEELMEEYLTLKEKGASQSSLFAALKRYLHSAYEADPSMLAVELKMINVEPFIHNTTSEVLANNPAKIDYYCKLYFSEWRQLQDFNYLLVTKEEVLRQSLIEYATAKMALEPTEAVEPTVSITERQTTQ